MQHAEAHERLADLALEPRAFLAFDRDRSPDHEGLRAHVSGCATCSADVEAWRGTHAAVLEVLGYAPVQGSVAPFDDQPIALPPGLRAVVARIPREEAASGAGAQPGAPVRPRPPRRRFFAASVVARTRRGPCRRIGRCRRARHRPGPPGRCGSRRNGGARPADPLDGDDPRGPRPHEHRPRLGERDGVGARRLVGHGFRRDRDRVEPARRGAGLSMLGREVRHAHLGRRHVVSSRGSVTGGSTRASRVAHRCGRAGG